MDLKSKVRTVPDYPVKGVMFRDINTVIQDKEGLREAVNQIMKNLDEKEFDYVIGPESRGFIFGMPIAYNMNKGFIPIRKAGKLPGEVISKTYALEYATATLEVQKDLVKKGDRIVIVDDLLATGGTCRAMISLLEEIGAKIVSLNFFIEIEELNGRKTLDGYKINSVIKY